MGSPESEDRTYILSVTIQDGKAFGPDLQAVACAATFAGETKLTSYSVGRDTHVWNTTLQWRVTMDQFRRLTSLGQKDCKVVLTSKDGAKLGWFLVDVRAAKLQAQYKKTEGMWVGLTGARKGDAPQVCMLALFYEDRPGVSFSPEAKQSPNKSRNAARRQQVAGRDSTAAGAAAIGDGQDGAPGPDHQPSAADGGGEPGAEVGRLSAVAAAPPAPNPTAGLPNFGSPTRNPAEDGPFRHFALTVDVRSFQSGKRLPLSSACVYVRAVLPAELIELVVSSGFRLPSRLAPLCSHPAVDIPRGAEGSLPNGYGTLEFSAGVVQLARMLAREPRISLEAWHKERFRTDMLLGAGSVPLTPLLQGAWVDGYAPLFALVASSVGGEVREERVQMGLLRVVLSLEDKGIAPPPGGAPAGQAPALVPSAQAGATVLGPAGAAEALGLRQRPSPYPDRSSGGEDGGRGGGGDALGDPALEVPRGELSIREMHPTPPSVEQEQGGSAAAVSAAGAAGGQAQLQGQQPLPTSAFLQQAYSRAAPPAVSFGSPLAFARPAGGSRPALMPRGMVGAAGAAVTPGGPEFEAAWELEVWKKAEEARWRSELREREAQRMLVLESEWRRRERAREAEVAGLKAEYLALEERAQQALAAAEARERRILAAEEALLRRRKELEREHAGRMMEAEAAVRRLQVECEHQLDIERARNAELVRRVAAQEERLGASEMRCLTVENEFADFRAAARATPEAELARQLAEAREAVKAAEARAAKAAKAKQGYKEQVRKMAEQMAALQQQQRKGHQPLGGGAGGSRGSDFDDPLAALRGPVPHGLVGAADGAAAILAAAEEQARYAASQQQELATMRATLQAIKAAALAQLSPPGSPRGRPDADDGDDGGGAAAGAGAEEAAADLRSNDQQRPARAQWRIGGAGGGGSRGVGGGRAASQLAAGAPASTAGNAARAYDQASSGRPVAAPPSEPHETPLARAAGGAHACGGGRSSSTSPVEDGGSSSTVNSTARQPPRGGAADAAAAVRPPPSDRLDDTTIRSGDAANRWAEPRPAASAPPRGGDSVGGGLLSPPAGPEPGSGGRAASAPPVTTITAGSHRVSMSTSMTRPMAVAVAAPAVAAMQQQRRGWGHAVRGREAEKMWQRGEEAAAAGGGAGGSHARGDDNGGRWGGGSDGADPPRPTQGSYPQDRQQRQQLQQQQRLAPNGGGARGDARKSVHHDDHDDVEAFDIGMSGDEVDEEDASHRRSLADHLANASAAASSVARLRGLHRDYGEGPPRGSAAGGSGRERADPREAPEDPGRDRAAADGSPSGATLPDGERGRRPGAPRAGWQLPQPQRQQPQLQRQHDDDGGDGFEGASGGGGDPDADLVELRRLARRQTELLQQGYAPEDPLLAVLDERIQALIAGG